MSAITAPQKIIELLLCNKPSILLQLQVYYLVTKIQFKKCYLHMSLISPGINCLWFSLAIFTWDPWTITCTLSWRSLGSFVFPHKYCFIIDAWGVFGGPKRCLICLLHAHLSCWVQFFPAVWPFFSRHCSVLTDRAGTILSISVLINIFTVLFGTTDAASGGADFDRCCCYRAEYRGVSVAATAVVPYVHPHKWPEAAVGLKLFCSTAGKVQEKAPFLR